VNFIIYCIFSDKFKRMLSSLVWGMLGRTDLARKYQNTVTYRINDQPSQAAFLLRKMSTSPLLPSKCQQPQGQLQSARVLSTPTTSSTSLQPTLSHLPQPRSSADFSSVGDSQQANKMKCFLSKSQSASYLKIDCGGGDKSLCQNRIGTQLSGNEVFYICDTSEKKSSRREET